MQVGITVQDLRTISEALSIVRGLAAVMEPLAKKERAVRRNVVVNLPTSALNPLKSVHLSPIALVAGD